MVTAHALAHAHPRITAEMVEAVEFPQLVQRYNVRGVPKTVINENISFEGSVPESVFVQKVLEAVK